MGRNKKSVSEAKFLSTATKLDGALYRRLEFVVEKQNLTISQVLRTAVKEYVERFEKSRKVAA